MDILITSNGSRSIAQRGSDTVRKLIQSGELAPGDQLPSLREFAQANEISRATAQRVYSMLEDDGLIITEQGTGSRVSPNALDETEQGVITLFWSYAHKDDENSKGAVSDLLEAIEAEFELQTGTRLHVFKDSTSISWGTNWRNRISEALLSTTVFVPVLTPTYLKRPACLSELRTVYALYKENGLECGIYPIRFVDISRALKHFADDELANLIGDTQGVNFYEVGTRDPSSKLYADAVSNIVTRLIEIDDELSCRHEAVEIALGRAEDEADGILDGLAEMEEAVANQEVLLANLTNDMQSIGDLTARKAQEIRLSDQKNGGFAGRLSISKSLAKEMRPLAEDLLNHSREFSHAVQSIDRGVKAYVNICANKGAQSRSEEFENGILSLAKESDFAIQQCKGYIATLNETKKISRDLREPIEIVTRGLDLFCSNGAFFNEWAEEVKSLD